MRIQHLFAVVLIISGCSTSPVLHGIGVYEGSYPAGRIDIHVRTQGHPVILGLCSYEAVTWNITADDGVVIREIILSGYNKSKVRGVADNVKITRQAFGYTYEPNAKNSGFAKHVKDYTGLEVESFQGMYTGKEFSIH